MIPAVLRFRCLVSLAILILSSKGAEMRFYFSFSIEKVNSLSLYYIYYFFITTLSLYILNSLHLIRINNGANVNAP